MSGVSKLVLGGVALLVAAATVGWIFRVSIMLTAIGVAADRRTPVGPHQEVVWESGPDPAGRSKAERPPNIVVILADDLGWNDLSFQGGGVAGGTVTTPNIDSIASDGVSFVNGYAANGTCAPSRAAILSGRYGTRFGFEFTPTPAGMSTMVGMIADQMPGRLRSHVAIDVPDDQLSEYEDMGMPASEITIAELLKKADYQTAHIGKWHVGRSNGMAAVDQGFDQSLLMHSGLYLREDDPNVVNAKVSFDPIDHFLWHGLKWAASLDSGPAFEPGGYLTDYYTDEAVKVIEANKDRPFFLYLAHWAPHTPLQATREDYEALSHIEDHRLRVYAAMIRALDRGVGRVLQALRDNGLEENTLVFFTSDNGGAGYIGLDEVNQPYRGWKISFFEGGIHVPYFIKWPARIPAGGVQDAPVHGFDIYSTAAAAAGVPLPTDREIDGVDLVPYARGEGESVPHERLFWRTGHYQVALVDGWKLQVNERVGRDWLFHLREDPTEQRDLASSMPGKVAELKQALAEHNAAQADPAWPSGTEMVINVDKSLRHLDEPDDEYIYWPN